MACKCKFFLFFSFCMFYSFCVFVFLSNNWLRRVFFYFCTFYIFWFFLHFYHFLRFLIFVLFVLFCTFCTFVLCHLVGQSIWISMQNLESVAQKMAELWVLLYFFVLFVLLYFCTVRLIPNFAPQSNPKVLKPFCTS